MLGFNADGTLRFGSVNWINNAFGISYPGNVGIGTASPSAGLHIASTNDGIMNLQTQDNTWLYTQWLNSS